MLTREAIAPGSREPVAADTMDVTLDICLLLNPDKKHVPEASGNTHSGQLAAMCPTLALQKQEQGSLECLVVLQKGEFREKRGDDGRWSGEVGTGWDRLRHYLGL